MWSYCQRGYQNVTIPSFFFFFLKKKSDFDDGALTL